MTGNEPQSIKFKATVNGYPVLSIVFCDSIVQEYQTYIRQK